MAKKIELLFYNVDPSEENTGMKQVLFEITDNVGNVTYDYGYADWLGREWGEVPVPPGFTIKVNWWANNPDPKILLKEESKIIKLQ